MNSQDNPAATPTLHPVALDQSPYARHLGLRITHATADRIEGEMTVTPELINRNGVLHGGAIMSFADSVAGTGSFVHLGPGEGTTTVESKTNFFRPVLAGDTVKAIAVPLHRGRKTTVWQTTILRGDGKLAAMVIQTQMTLRKTDAG